MSQSNKPSDEEIGGFRIQEEISDLQLPREVDMFSFFFFFFITSVSELLQLRCLFSHTDPGNVLCLQIQQLVEI